MTDPITDNRLRALFAPRYQLERELTGGGMSRVFLATEMELERKVVLKILPPDLAAGVNRERFRREIQFAAQLQHPHIVPLYTAGVEGDLLYYTMPYIEGESLKHALQEEVRFTPRQVVRILHDVVDALRTAHARGVIHRDIKPGNVLRSGDHAVVTDFGVAKAISAAMPAVGMTTSGMAIGTPAYMAPEQLAGDPKADHRVDIYAVGLLAYELLVGDSPFAATSPQETMAAQLTRQPEPIEKTRKDVPPALTALIMRCLAKRPEDRPQSAAELLTALDAMELPSGEFQPMSRRSGGLLAGAGIAAAALLAVALWRRGDDAPPPPVRARTVDTVTESRSDPLLTRAESLAIATAVAQQLDRMRPKAAPRDTSAGKAPARGASAAATPAPAATDLKKLADSLRDEIQRAIFDSLARTRMAGPPPGLPQSPGQPPTRVFVDARGGRGNRGMNRGEIDSLISAARGFTDFRAGGRGNGLDPAAFEARARDMGPPRRIVVTEPAQLSNALRDATPYVAQVVDSLRHTLARQRRYVVVDQDSVRAALQKTRTIDDLMQLLNADLFATPRVSRVGNDSLSWTITLRDLTANPAYGTRSWGTQAMGTAQKIDGFDGVLAKLMKDLDEMDHAPRRRPPDTAPGGPLSKEAYDARARAMGPPRRLVIWSHPKDAAHPDIETMGTQALDMMRKGFSGLSRYVLLPRDTTFAVLAKTRARDEVAKALGADMMITIRGSAQRADSVYWTVTVWDLTAYPALEQRTVTAGRAAASAPLSNVDSLYKLAVRAAEELDKAPRRP